MNFEKKLLSECKKQIEEKLKWGSSETWKQRDYENLIQLIYNETDVLLSLTTIKRIWKKEFDQTPHPSTLNALARYLGNKDWLEFKNENASEFSRNAGKNFSLDINKRSIAAVIIFLLCVVILFIWSGSEPYVFKRVEMTSRKVVSSGVPNTVIFDYDLKKASDSVYFQQSWNPNERVFVSPEEEQLTAIYYFPGYHEAKLIIHDEIITSVPVHITTADWLMSVRYDTYDIKPVYVATNALKSLGALHVTPENLKTNAIDIEGKDYWISFFNVKDFGEVYGNNFELNTEFRNSVIEGGLLCQYLHLYIYCEKSAMVIPFGNVGCASNFNFTMFDKVIRGRNKDMTLFGSNMNEWNKLKVSVKKKQCAINLNDKEIFVDSFSVNPGKIVGIHYMFYGTGSVDNVALSDSGGTLIYSDDFE